SAPACRTGSSPPGAASASRARSCASTPTPGARSPSSASSASSRGRPMPLLLDGRPVAARVQAEVASGVAELRARGVTPTLAVVLVGRDPASEVYVGRKRKACVEAGIVARDRLFPDGLDEAGLLAVVRELDADPGVHGILVQLPLPGGLDEDRVIGALDPAKDVDGLHPENLGRLLAGRPAVVPCTPAGVLEILDHYGIELKGAEAVVVGRSRLFGKPLSQLLL